MNPNPLALVCVAVLCTILSLGLWPFHSPHNGVVWLMHRNGLRFSKYGTVISSRTLSLTNEETAPDVSIEVWLQPRCIWYSGTVLAAYRPGNLFQFSVRQSQTDALLRIETQDNHNHTRTSKFLARDAFRKARPTFLTITGGRSGTTVYIDGVHAASAPDFPLTAKTLTGQLVLGDSPGQTDIWSGEMLGLAVYRHELTAAQTFTHYVTWQQTGRPRIPAGEHARALYLFHEGAGAVVVDETHRGTDLLIPKQYQVMDQILLEPIWSEFELTRSYFDAAVKNVVGFIPLGFWFYAYLQTRFPRRRAALVAVLSGTAVSFTIEFLQAFLPTRDSGTTDIVTNTIGSWIGVAGYDLLVPFLTRFFLRPGDSERD